MTPLNLSVLWLTKWPHTLVEQLSFEPKSPLSWCPWPSTIAHRLSGGHAGLCGPHGKEDSASRNMLNTHPQQKDYAHIWQFYNSAIGPWEQGLSESTTAIPGDKLEPVVRVDICCLFLQLPTRSQRWGRLHEWEMTHLVAWLLMLIVRLNWNYTEGQFHKMILFACTLPTM